MIIGVGIDIVEVARIEKAMQKQQFIEKLFSPAEISNREDPKHIAGRWAAKEAIAKAVPLSMSWKDVEILSHESGAPFVRFSEKVKLKTGWTVHVSITHEGSHAAAVAILEES